MIISLLMGRKGSKGFPGKNTFPVLGKPLAYYPLYVAANTPSIEKAFLSTDDPELMALAESLGVGVIQRPPELCGDGALGDHVYHHAYQEVKSKIAPKKIDMIALLMCNCPTVSLSQVEKGIQLLLKDPEADSAVTVSRYNMWSPLRARKENSKGYLNPFVPLEVFGNPETLNCDRDSQGDVWFADMGVSVIRPKNLDHIETGLLPQKWMGHKILPLKQDAGLDVDYEWQIPQIEWWIKNHFEWKKGDGNPK